MDRETANVLTRTSSAHHRSPVTSGRVQYFIQPSCTLCLSHDCELRAWGAWHRFFHCGLTPVISFNYWGRRVLLQPTRRLPTISPRLDAWFYLTVCSAHHFNITLAELQRFKWARYRAKHSLE